MDNGFPPVKADDLEDLHAQVRDAVRCHFDEGEARQ
jgi:hypothetical protein